MSPLDDVMSEDVKARYLAALATLSPADRELIVQRFEEESTYETIAERCGLASANQARVSFSRAIQRLASEMAGTAANAAPIPDRHSRVSRILRLLWRWPWRDSHPD
jgi:DNA-directed RNA polymerase specialized sigma24 family protein